jgi:hypothetical protein
MPTLQYLEHRVLSWLKLGKGLSKIICCEQSSAFAHPFLRTRVWRSTTDVWLLRRILEMLQIVSTGQGNLVYDVLKPIVQGTGIIPFSAPNHRA